jgi:hypothetical protein
MGFHDEPPVNWLMPQPIVYQLKLQECGMSLI